MSSKLNRRELIGGAAAGALVTALGGSDAAARDRGHRGRGAHRGRHDVAIVGGGLAGLTTATILRAAGHSVIVLEARDRVGGRNFDHRLAAGKVAELGGEWAGPGQDRILALAKHLGVSTFATYSTGKSVYYSNGQIQTYSGDIPPANVASLVKLEAAIVELNGMAAKVPAATPWTAPGAAGWDEQTIATWVDANLHTAEARNLLRLAVRGVYGEEAEQISLLDLLQAISGVGGDINTLIGSAQSIRFVGGPQQFSIKLAHRLRHAVHLRQPVTAISYRRHVALHTATHSFEALRAVIAIPKTLMGRIAYDPPLPPAHDQILQREPMGSVVKVNAIYPTPFWRSEGLNGAATSEVGPIRITYDNSPPDGSPGVLVGFMEGNDSRQFYGLDPSVRRQAALECFARYFGPRALTPSGYVDLAWAEEQYTRGAYGSFNPPGVLTSPLQDVTSEPIGPLHFAGSDTSPLWPGYMDGAIRSGERAAAEVMAQL